MIDPRQRLASLPSLGWVTDPSPVEPLGLSDSAEVWVKRDDLIDCLHGGSKVRKLDYLLAQARFRDAPGWVSAAAIGSGHLATLAAAAERCDKPLDVLMFWQTPTDHALENLAYVASCARRVSYRSRRRYLALSFPRRLFGRSHGGLAVVPPGATSAAGSVGMVRAGLEYAAQVAEGLCPAPSRVVVPLGSGGTAVGLAVGLALGGLKTPVHAVAAVERMFSTRGRVRRLTRRLIAWLAEAGVPGAEGLAPCAIHIDRSQLGTGYGTPTEASLDAVERVADQGLALEPVYTGKAMAALLEKPSDGAVLFWLTRRGVAPLACDPDWRRALPRALVRRLDGKKAVITRRRLLLGGLGVAAVAGTWRFTGYDELPNWQGRVLSAREAAILTAVAGAILPPAPSGPPLAEVARRVDDYLTSMPPHLRRDIHGLLLAVEHGTTPLLFSLRRLTRLQAAEREAFLAELAQRDGIQFLLYRGVRDLCMMGYYQHPETWPALSYSGPMLPAGRTAPLYDALRAPSGGVPSGTSAEGAS